MMSKILNFFKLYRGPMLSGILIATSYTPFPAWALLFCYVPLWLFITEKQRSWKEVFWGAWITQFILSLIGFHWVAYVSYTYGHLPWPVSFLALIAFCCFIHLYIPLAALLSVWIGRRWGLNRNYVLLFLAVTLNLSERWWPAIFPWNLGYSLYSSGLPVFQFADIIGFLGLSLLVLLSNAALAIWWKERKSWKIPAVVALLFIAFNLLGSWHGRPWDQTDSELKALIVQANIGNLEKVQAEKGQDYQDSIIQKFISLSQQGLSAHPEAEVLFWPETAFPFYLDQRFLTYQYPQMLIQAVSDMGAALVTGAYSRKQTEENEAPVSYNSLAFIESSGKVLSPLYKKTHLLAFGEYLPFSEQFPYLLKLLPFISNFGRGEGPGVFPLSIAGQELHWGPQICYEGLYPEFSRKLALQGSQIFVNVTNDSWFGYPFEPRQHMYMTFARAIENRRPLVRSTNTGISSVALANGKVLEPSPLHTEWTGFYKVTYLKNPPLTFFSKWGHLDSVVVVALFAVLLAIGYRNARTQRP